MGNGELVPGAVWSRNGRMPVHTPVDLSAPGRREVRTVVQVLDRRVRDLWNRTMPGRGYQR